MRNPSAKGSEVSVNASDRFNVGIKFITLSQRLLMTLRFANMIAPRSNFRVHQLQPRQSTSIRPFGKDLTNCETRSSNISFVQKPVRKCEVLRIRSSLKNGERGKITMQQTFPTAQLSPKKGTNGRATERSYEDEVALSLLELDCSFQPTDNPEITEKMRAMLIDWLVDVHDIFKLNGQTLHLCLRYLDDYLSKVEVAKSQFQLVGITCLWVASKFEEIYPPKKQRMVDMTARACTVEQLIEMESKIMNALNFRLMHTTSYQILALVLNSQLEQKFGCLCQYLCEMSYTEGLSKRYRPSTIALTSVNLANSILKTEHDRIQHFKEKFKTTNEETVNCFREVCRILHAPNKYGLKAIKKKYASERFWKVSGVKLGSQL